MGWCVAASFSLCLWRYVLRLSISNPSWKCSLPIPIPNPISVCKYKKTFRLDRLILNVTKMNPIIPFLFFQSLHAPHEAPETVKKNLRTKITRIFYISIWISLFFSYNSCAWCHDNEPRPRGALEEAKTSIPSCTSGMFHGPLGYYFCLLSVHLMPCLIEPT